ncbi:MAG TPA: DUF1385 domain-containing protein [Fibrobacteres bacterium]|nr:DUF1385 domain-containing protein [Fibrobacterota bacterium]
MSPVGSLFLRVQGGLFHLLNHQPETIGGQAVVKGVMMRSPTRLSVAVRAPDGRIALQDRPFVSFSKRHKILGLPVLRGGASLVESLYLGMQCLNWSVKIQEAGSVKEEKEEVPTTAMQKAKTVLPLFLSFAAALALFQLLPYGVAAFVTGGSHSHPQNPVLFNFVAGLIRISLLLAYLWGLSFLPDLKRVFQYHGAEHKSIFAYEKKAPLEIPTVAQQTRFHPRCGTSFILIVALTCMLFFSIFDSIVLHGLHYAYPNFLVRFLIHLPFVPLVAGLAFEILRLSGKHQDSKWIRPFILPGLWLQKITTQEPEEAQIEVALVSVKASLA